MFCIVIEKKGGYINVGFFKKRYRNLFFNRYSWYDKFNIKYWSFLIDRSIVLLNIFFFLWILSEKLILEKLIIFVL